jgi:hypothetical protein
MQKSVLSLLPSNFPDSSVCSSDEIKSCVDPALGLLESQVRARVLIAVHARRMRIANSWAATVIVGSWQGCGSKLYAMRLLPRHTQRCLAHVALLTVIVGLARVIATSCDDVALVGDAVAV